MNFRANFRLAHIEAGDHQIDQQNNHDQAYAPVFGQRRNERCRSRTRERLVLAHPAERTTDPACFVILQENQADQNEATDDMDGDEEPVQVAH